MAKHVFTPPEKLAVHRILGPNCIWCKEPVPYRDCEIDHIVPESVDNEKLKRIIADFKLPLNFSVNSFYNWAPIHTRCNRGKSKKTFDNAPFIGEILQTISKRVPEIEKVYEEAKRDLANPMGVAQLENALKTKQITNTDIQALLGKHNRNTKIKSSKIYEVFNCKTQLFSEKGRIGKTGPRQLFNIEYEQFGSDLKSLTELNAIIKAEAMSELMSARQNYFSYLRDLSTDDDPFFNSDSTHDYSMSFSLVTKRFASYTSLSRFYHTGAAHDQYSITGHNYYMDSLRPFNLTHIINDYNKFIEVITPLAYAKMIKEIETYDSELEVTDFYPIEKSWLTTEYHAFDNYHFTDSSLVFIFNPYQISAWAFGAHFPEFSFAELKALFPMETQLLELLSIIEKSAAPNREKKKS